MKNIKFATLATTVLLAGGILAGCTSDAKTESSSSTPESSVASSTEDVVTSASISDKPEVIASALAADGNWLAAATGDITFDTDLVVDGEFHDKDDASAAIYRKLALHTQDEKFNILENFTLTAPKVIVNSENFVVFYGTIKGDIEVNANGFALIGTKVDGNITFTKEEYKESADLDKDGKGASVTGEVTVAE